MEDDQMTQKSAPEMTELAKTQRTQKSAGLRLKKLEARAGFEPAKWRDRADLNRQLTLKAVKTLVPEKGVEPSRPSGQQNMDFNRVLEGT